jgi:hypothetical protein
MDAGESLPGPSRVMISRAEDAAAGLMRYARPIATIGIVGAALYAGYKGFQWLTGTGEPDYMPASFLGKRGQGLDRALFGETESLSAETEATLKSGKYFQSVMNETFGMLGEAEVEVSDKDLGVKGFVDALLPGNIPVEIKTISSKGLEKLSRPLEPHVSQINFYMHARRAQYGYLLYLDGADISKRKVFRVGYQPSRLIVDVDAARDALLMSPERASQDQIEWLQNTYQTSPAHFRGIRHSSGSASSFDSMKAAPNFPGGRIASVVQASKYTPHGGRNTIPTLGLTTRCHERAINHRARGGIAKKRTGAPHCNGSRRYR